MSANFEVGQVVQLKPGGPEMTVVSVAEGKIQAAYNCTWFVGDKQHFGDSSESKTQREERPSARHFRIGGTTIE